MEKTQQREKSRKEIRVNFLPETVGESRGGILIEIQEKIWEKLRYDLYD